VRGYTIKANSINLASTRTATGLARSQQYAARLNAAVGPAKLLAVHKGDTVRFTAPGLYQQPVRNPRFGFFPHSMKFKKVP
jgi:hypothetical protein